jgi:hypothetical protein
LPRWRARCVPDPLGLPRAALAFLLT